MTSIIKLTPLSGDQDTSAPCFLLQIDQFKCLLDCGWDEKFCEESVAEIEKHFKTLDAILLSYPDPYHVGALPYLVKKCGLSCPIYATRPVRDMGKMFMTDLLLSRLNGEEFNLFDVNDINYAFDQVTQLEYKQQLHLEDQGYGLTITPLAAGHMIGGSIWKIIKDNEEDIVYAIDYNHKKERHLNGCDPKLILRPSLLITDAYNTFNHQGRMRERDEKFIATIIDVLRKGGNVLIACDTAGRVLELAYTLERIWRLKEYGFSAYSLALVSNVASKMIELAKSTIEYMSKDILKEFESSRDNPFTFKHLQLKQFLEAKDSSRKNEALSSMPQGAQMAVLATQPDLECGFSRDLFTLWCRDERNCIIFTQRPNIGTLGFQIFNWCNMPTDIPERLIDLEIRQRIELQGEELELFLKKAEEERQAKELEKQKELEDKDSDSENEPEKDEDEQTADEKKDVRKLAVVPRTNKHDLMIRDGRTKGPVFFQRARKSHLMFPAPADVKIRWDDYGEIINTEEYEVFHTLPGAIKQAEIEENKENITKTKQLEVKVPEVAPTKCVRFQATLDVKAKICYFDFEGRSDGESLKNLISQIKPRRLILVRGSPESSAHMAEYCKAYVDEKVFVTTAGDTIDATTENHIYQAKLKDSLVSTLNFVKADNGAELAWVDAQTEVPENDEVNNDNLPYLDLVNLDDIPLHKSIFVNEVKLSDFKHVLLSNGIQAEFSNQILYCNDKVAIRRKETGKLHLEGTLCADYFKVRDLLYQQYVVI